jgi:hypothetical protein
MFRFAQFFLQLVDSFLHGFYVFLILLMNTAFTFDLIFQLMDSFL